MIQIAQPFQNFVDTSGQPLDNGYVYVGTADQNPETNAIAVYWDAALTIPAAQPIRTIAGYLSRNGSPARLYADASRYSITVRDRNSAIIITAVDASTLDNLRADLAASTGSSLVGYIAAGASAIARTLQAKARDILHANDSIVGNGVANDIAALQAKHDEIVALGIKRTLRVSGVIKLNSMLTINSTFVQIEGDNAVFDFSSLAAGTAVKITGRASGTPYQQSRGGLNGVELIGPGIATSTTGIEFDTAAEAGTSHTNYFAVNVHGFGTGHEFKRNAYAINFWGCDVWNCATGTFMPTGHANYGERINYFGSTIFNNTAGVINNNANGAFHFTSCSFDYNGVQAVAQAGRIFFHQSHIEAATYATPPFVTHPVDGATIVINGGWMLCTGANTSDIFQSQTTAQQGGGIFVRDVSVNAMGTGRWKSGVGRFELTNPISYNTSNNPKLSSAAENKLMDGGFEAATVLDAFITEDTAAITSRVTGTNIILTTSATAARTGAKSLKAAKAFGGGSVSAFCIPATLARRGSLSNQIVYYKKPGAGTGDMFISTWYAQIMTVGGVDTIVKSVVRGTTTVTFTAAAVDWTSYADGEPMLYAPPWATHSLIYVSLVNFVGPDAIYFDDAEFYEY